MNKLLKNFTIISLITFSPILYAGELNLEKGNQMINLKADISLELSNNIINYAQNIAKERNLNLSIAIVDSSGYLVAFNKMNDASLVTIDVAIQKAKTAALLKAPSKPFEDKINSGATSMVTVPNLTPLQGGIPIIYKGQVCGAVGISGASGDIDNEIATLSAQKFEIK